MIIMTHSNGSFNGKFWLYLAQNCPGHSGIRFTGVRIRKGPLYFELGKRD